MGQQGILRFLQKQNNKWFTSKEISREVGISQGAAIVCLKTSRDKNEVIFGRTSTPGENININGRNDNPSFRTY